MGGQSIAKFDYDLAPGVAKTYINEICRLLDIYDWIPSDVISSFKKEMHDYIAENKRIIDNKELINKTLTKYIEHYASHTYLDAVVIPHAGKEFCNLHTKALKYTNKATYQSMEAFVHNMNTLCSRAGSQVPFSSVNYGTDISTEGRILTSNLLHALDAGLGSGETPIFPIHVFKVKDGINGNPGDPNYDLFQLACRVSGKRLFPNFTFIDAPFNIKYYKEGRPETESATMGCLAGHHKITVKDFPDIHRMGVHFFSGIISLEDAYNSVSVVEEQRGLSLYKDVESKLYYVCDSSSNTYVKIRKIIKNPDMGNWVKIVLQNGQEITATNDHPFQVYKNNSNEVQRVFVKDLTINDYLVSSIGERLSIKSIEFLGSIGKCSYDLETESDKFDFDGIRSHNCRTRVVGNIHDPEREIFTGRGNLSFTSINLPRLAIESEKNVDVFMSKLDKVIDMVFDQLLDRFEVQAKKKCKNYPFMMGQGIYLDSEKLGPEDEIREVIKHGTLTLGFIGLAEALVALTGKHHGESEESQELGLKIVSFFRKKCDDKSKETKLNFSVIGTPAEGLSGRFIDLDKKKFGIIPGVTERAYYTNSSHVPVYYPISISKKIDIEAPYHELENGGHICYVELDGDTSSNPQAFESVIQYMKKAGIGYGSINHPVDRDPVCGYLGVINDTCPRCGRKEYEGVSERKLAEILACNKEYRPSDEVAEEGTKVTHTFN